IQEISLFGLRILTIIQRGSILPPASRSKPAYCKDQVRRHTVIGVVDCGAAKLVLPQTLVKQLGLLPGDKITVRDERQFPTPDILDITREPNKNLSFGPGTHICIEASLAMLEGSSTVAT